MSRIEPNKPSGTSELFGCSWEMEQKTGLIFYKPFTAEMVQEDEMHTVTATITTLNRQIAVLYPGVSVVQRIVLCPENFYVKRFREKAEKYGFDPTRWVDWSEGDIDVINGVGKVFCVRMGANFQSQSDRRRFFAHELGHPYASTVSPIYNFESPEFLPADTEGLVEADARVGLNIQHRDMQFSRDFIKSLREEQLALASDIAISGYDHPAFRNSTVSLNPGYASCFLWYLGQALKVSDTDIRSDLRQRYFIGRQKLLNNASRAQTKTEFKKMLQNSLGFNYDKEARNLDFLIETRQHFLDFFT